MSEEAKSRKWRPLEKMFNEVPETYDLLNKIITWGQDKRWRRFVSKECLGNNPSMVLDLCTGTGDLALQMAKELANPYMLHALDYSDPMLQVARKKAARKGYTNIEFIQGDASDMPYDTDSMDSIGITFAFRNLTYKNPGRDKYLAEIFRILKPGGKFVIVESSQPANRIWKFFFRIYLKVFVSWIGGIISGQRAAYRYLAASARNYYNASEIAELLLNAGFRDIRHRSFFGGITRLTVVLK